MQAYRFIYVTDKPFRLDDMSPKQYQMHALTHNPTQQGTNALKNHKGDKIIRIWISTVVCSSYTRLGPCWKQKQKIDAQA